MSRIEPEDRSRAAFLAALEGDRAAYRSFLDNISGRLRIYLRQQLRQSGRTDPGEAEDVLQETLLAIHLSRHTYNSSSSVVAWVYAIARYKLIDHLRRNGRHSGSLQIEDDMNLPDESDLVGVDSRLDLHKAMKSLPERTRSLIELVKLQGHSVADAARSAGMTETAAKVSIHRGLRQLARKLANSE